MQQKRAALVHSRIKPVVTEFRSVSRRGRRVSGFGPVSAKADPRFRPQASATPRLSDRP